MGSLLLAATSAGLLRVAYPGDKRTHRRHPGAYIAGHNVKLTLLNHEHATGT